MSMVRPARVSGTPSTSAARPEGTCAERITARTARVRDFGALRNVRSARPTTRSPPRGGLLTLTCKRLEEARIGTIPCPVAHVTKLLLSPQIR